MGHLAAFLEANWFNVVQTFGIIASLLFTAMTLRQGLRSTRITSLLALEEQHRELWSELHRRPELARILDPAPDLVGQPVSSAEAEYLNTVFVHFCTGWRLATEHRILLEDDLGRDIAEFLKNPIPSQVWTRTTGIRERRFVAFVEKVRQSLTSERAC